jgi:hypothetical protein
MDRKVRRDHAQTNSRSRERSIFLGGSGRGSGPDPGTEMTLGRSSTPGRAKSLRASSSTTSRCGFCSSCVCGLVGVVLGRAPLLFGKLFPFISLSLTSALSPTSRVTISQRAVSYAQILQIIQVGLPGGLAVVHADVKRSRARIPSCSIAFLHAPQAMVSSRPF